MEKDLANPLAAPCGLYCGACAIYVSYHTGDPEPMNRVGRVFAKLAEEGVSGVPPLKEGAEFSLERAQSMKKEDFLCEGCVSDVVALPCRVCALRDCAMGRGLATCAQCPDYPCQDLVSFNNDGIPHHGEVLANTRRQRDVGLDAWIEEQRARWQCPRCGRSLDWYAMRCPGCGADAEETLGSPDLLD